MNTERIRAALSVMGANEECLYKRINRYAKGGDTENLVEAINKIDRMQECISIIRREIADEIGKKRGGNDHDKTAYEDDNSLQWNMENRT